MARQARLKVSGEMAWYHVYASVAAVRGEYPLQKPLCREQLMNLLKFYASGYCCDVAALCLMGNHWHAILRFEKPRKLSKAELMERALRLYPRSEDKLKAWSPEQWKRFEERLFDVSELMRNIQAGFARWYNRTFNRKGRFWAERFKSTILADSEAIRDAILYVELNGVRAGLAQRPEEFEGSSAYLRELKQDGWLLPLSAFLDRGPRAFGTLFTQYKSLLYHRGAVPTKEGQAAISPELLALEGQRGFERSGGFLKQLRYYTDGLLIGAERVVREQLSRMQASGDYERRLNPIEQREARQFSLREQRGHFIPLK